MNYYIIVSLFCGKTKKKQRPIRFKSNTNPFILQLEYIMTLPAKEQNNLKQFKGTRFVKKKKRSEMILQKCLQTCLKSIYSDCIPCYSCERIVRDSLPIKTIAMINSPHWLYSYQNMTSFLALSLPRLHLDRQG